MNIQLENNEKNGRAVATVDRQQVGEMTFVWAGDQKIIIDHTEVDESQKGKGVGKQLLNKIIEMVDEKSIKVMPLCPYAKHEFDKNPSLQQYLI